MLFRSMGELHDRMPVILSEKIGAKWLGEEAAGVKESFEELSRLP